jgi:hypothetical protein
MGYYLIIDLVKEMGTPNQTELNGKDFSPDSNIYMCGENIDRQNI